MRHLTQVFFLSSILVSATAAESRYVSLVTTNTSFPASLSLLSGETAEVVTSRAYVYDIAARVEKGDQIFCAATGFTVSGPATIVAATCGGTSYGPPYLLTLKITPDTYDVNKTIIVPPATNQVQVSLECSTNLVNWTTATNGIYGSPDSAHFFRIKVQN